jgi:hypothetical protein
VRLWTRVGPDALEVRGSDAAWPLLGMPIGADRPGRAFGCAEGMLGRIALDGAPDWQVALDTITVEGGELQRPRRSSITGDGEVLVGIAGPDEFVVAALTGP